MKNRKIHTPISNQVSMFYLLILQTTHSASEINVRATTAKPVVQNLASKAELLSTLRNTIFMTKNKTHGVIMN